MNDLSPLSPPSGRPRSRPRPPDARPAAASGVVRFSVRSGLLRPAMVLDVLERLSAETSGPLDVVVGAHDAYRDEQVAAWVRRTRGRMALHPTTTDDGAL